MRRPPQKQILIAVTGITGGGKTTFVSKATGRGDLKIGHGLESCTEVPYPVRFRLDGRDVVLIDTPGFDDSVRSDVDSLDIVARYLEEAYGKGQLLHGVILLHPITATRITGSERKRTLVFEKILGEDAYSRVAIATTMWDLIREDPRVQHRMDGRQATIWKDMHDKGARIVRHHNTRESALDIIRPLMRFADPKPLQIQTELEEYEGVLRNTSAGRVLQQDLNDRLARGHAELARVQLEVEELKQEQDQILKELKEKREEIDGLRKQGKQLRKEVRELKEKLERLEELEETRDKILDQIEELQAQSTKLHLRVFARVRVFLNSIFR